MTADGDATIRSGTRAAHAPLSPITVFLCVVATWIVPGAGHWLLGRRGKALLYFGLIAFAYAFGLWLAAGRNVRLDQDTMDLYFFGESFCGGFTLAAWWLTKGLELAFEQPLLDAGLLFSTVAGLLNLCVMVDVYETARPTRGGRRMKSELLFEHVGLFVLLVLIVSVVYNGLRRERVSEIVRVGLQRGLFFILVSLIVFGGGGYLLAQWL